MGDNHTTVFYSWQSDTPPKTNRYFIEEALKQAIKQLATDAEVLDPLRDESIRLDKDTANVPGSPPIITTIMRKIEECGAFVADLTFVGQSSSDLQTPMPRQFPNPNVAIEYGYALKACGHEKIIGVMNEAYGKATTDSLPFDLRHSRWPIGYSLPPDEQNKATVRKQLTDKLVAALKPILLLRQSKIGVKQIEDFVAATPAENDKAVFHNTPADLLSEHRILQSTQGISVPNEARMFMRLMPVHKVEPFQTELAAKTAAQKAHLVPMGEIERICSYARNGWGAIAFEATESGELKHFTQLFLSKELWGVDFLAVNARHWGDECFATTYIERRLTESLAGYMKVYAEDLKVPYPWRLIVGFTKVRGYQLIVGRPDYGGELQGKLIGADLDWKTEITSKDQLPGCVLKQFFEYYWAKCGVSRPDKG